MGSLELPRSRAATSEASDARGRVLRLATSELDRAYRIAGLMLNSQDEAQDVTQEALLSAWRSASSLRNPEGFQAWFDRILINLCIDRLRGRTKSRVLDISHVSDGPAAKDAFQSILDRDEVGRAMTPLAAEERAVVILHYWSDLTLESVASHLGVPVGTVKSRLNRALKVMRTSLEHSHRSGGRT